MSGAAEADARAALRARQGPGARYDAPAAPASDLALARRGTAYFARVLNSLPDAAFAAPSRLPGWTRARVIAHVGYGARALGRVVESVRTGIDLPMYESEAARAAELDLGASLPPRALRNLFHHAAVHLDVEWRDLSDAGWDGAGHGRGGAPLALRVTPWLRAREVWLHAVDLDGGGSVRDFPPELLDRLLTELATQVGLDAAPVPTDRPAAPLSAPGVQVRGRCSDLVLWLAGRGAERLPGALPAMPLPRDEG